MKTATLNKSIVAFCMFLWSTGGYAQDDPLYFTHNFEDKSIYPSSRTATEQIFNEPYGEWRYVNANSGTNASYLRDGMGSRSLRMTKNNGSTVVLPVLDRGAKQLFFMEGRGDRQICVFTSTDGGKTWQLLQEVTTDKTTYKNIVDINSIKVNRVKLVNEGSGDADVDNISVSILAAGTKASLLTQEASEITKTSATVCGEITDAGDKELIEWGICWSSENATPNTTSEKIIATENPFKTTITNLEAGSKIYYRAYAITGAGTGYGEVKTFNTLDATLPVVETAEVKINNVSTDHKTMSGYTGGKISDNGGAPETLFGVVYDTKASPLVESSKKALATVKDSEGNFNVVMRLLPNTTYHYRAFAQNKAGTAYGEEKTVTTGDMEIAEFTDRLIFCSPQGDDNIADGSEEAPFYSLQKAIDISQPGDTIYMMAGTYLYDSRIDIYHNGTEEKNISVCAKDGRAVLDFSKMPYHGHSDNPYQGIRLCGSYWYFYRIDITKASDNGMLIERNKPTGGTSADVINAVEQAHDNIIEDCRFYKNGDTGLQLKNMASNNRIINCDAYLNCDEGQGDADGFAPKISVGDGNYFYGCRAWLNSDDGWDVFFKKDGGFGDNMTIILERCIAYKNGFLDENTIAAKGNGNGFKMGSDQGAMNVLLNGCLAICNKSKGFDQNHNAGDIIMNNCTGMTLKSISDKSYSYRIYESISSGHNVSLTNCIAINDNNTKDKLDKNTGLPKPGEEGKYGQYGRFEVDTTLDGLSVTTCEFRKASPDQFTDITNHAELMAERNSDGSLPYSTFARPKDNSHLIDRGTVVNATVYRGFEVDGIEYQGKAPDLGAYENTSEGTDISEVITEAEKGINIKNTHGGMLLITVAGNATGKKTAEIFDSCGKRILSHIFYGNTTAMRWKESKGIYFIKVRDEKASVACSKLLIK